MPFNPNPTLTDVSRRRFLGLAGAGAAALTVAPSRSLLAADSRPNPGLVSEMEFEVTYESVIDDLPRDAESVRLWMPLPPDDYAQSIADFRVTSSVPWSLERDPVYGSKVLFVDAGAELFSVRASYRVTRRRVGAEKVPLDPVSAQRYLQLTPRVRVNEDVAAFADRVIGSETRPYEVARRLFDGIREYLVYDKLIPGCGTGDTAWVMRHRRGKCDDYHALFMAILISRGIPLRWEQGFPLPLPELGTIGESGALEGDCTGAHCWVSFYDPERGFVPVDVSEADKNDDFGDFYFGALSPNRFKVSEGRNVQLSPAQGGDRLPNFAYAYAEADGIPLIYGANYENKINYVISRVEG